MYKQAQQLIIPLDKGHYGGPADTVSNLLYDSMIPLGFYWGEDVMIDDAGYLRGRPSLSYKVTYAANETGIGCFLLNGTYYSIATGSVVKYWSASAWNSVTSSPTYNSQIHVDYYGNYGTASPSAVISSGYGSTAPAYISSTAASTLTAAALGPTAQEEGRLFTTDTNGYIIYSKRGTYNSGYSNAVEGDGYYFSLGLPAYKVIHMCNLAGSLYVIKQLMGGGCIYIFKKVQTYSDPEDLIDQTCFSNPMGVSGITVDNGADGFTSIGGNIVAWSRGNGLGVMTEGGMDMMSEAIFARNKSNLDYDCLLASSDNHRVILVKPVGTTKTYAYNYINRTWALWNINVTGKGFGCAGGMFNVSGTLSPATLGMYQRSSTTDTSVVPIIYTPVMDMGEPHREKFLTKLFLIGRGITEVVIYRRMTPAETFTADQTISSPERVSYLPGDCRFGEMYLKITGNPWFTLKTLGVEFDVGREIYE